MTGTVAVTPQTAIMSIYINGELVSSEPVGNLTMNPFDSSISLFVGTDEEKRIIPLRYYTGLLDELRYFTSVAPQHHHDDNDHKGKQQARQTGTR